MSIREQLEADLTTFFENIEKQSLGDKKKTLRILIDKYAHLFSTPVLLDKSDFEMIKGYAQNFFVNSAFPKQIGPTRREISHHEAVTLSVIEGTINVLNNKECFRKLPRFDYWD